MVNLWFQFLGVKGQPYGFKLVISKGNDMHR